MTTPVRGRRRLGRALIFVGVMLWIPELYYAYVLLSTLLTPIRVGGQRVHLTVHINPSAWVLAIGWTLVSWGLIAWGVWVLRKRAP